MEIFGAIQNYQWGKKGSDSMVAQLASRNSSDFKIDQEKTYAELWMGDHPNAPSIIKKSGDKMNANLSYLFKVLSIRTALSIQVHPNKSEAQRLHAERPDVYKDPNHKPELAIAVTPFKALCGFRPYTEIYEFCEKLPPLKTILGGDEYIENLKSNNPDSLRKCYEKLMTTDAQNTAQCIKAILENYSAVLAAYNLLDLFKKVNNDFPNDVGVVSLFLLNLLDLKPGESIYLGANEIHAYIEGDCIECMACSDNVIRAGLTPKYKDISQLISSVNFKGGPAKDRLFTAKHMDAFSKVFSPPVDDFAVINITLPGSEKEYALRMKEPHYGAILLVLSGRRTLCLDDTQFELKSGSIIYIPPESTKCILFEAAAATNEEFVVYMATHNF